MMEFVNFFLKQHSKEPLIGRGIRGGREALGFEIFFNGGGEGFSDFFLKVVTVEQAFIFPIGDESHFHQDRGDVRGF